MGLNFALDELHATGWCELDSAGCAYDVDGRTYPTVGRVRREFESAGFDFSVERVEEFNCFRAEWRERGPEVPGQPAEHGAVVSQSEAEAAVFALAQFRRQVALQSA